MQIPVPKGKPVTGNFYKMLLLKTLRNDMKPVASKRVLSFSDVCMTRRLRTMNAM